MSRVSPRMEQKAALLARTFYVLPIEENGITYSVETKVTDTPRVSEHFLTATDTKKNIVWRTSVYKKIYIEGLEGDVQDVFVVDLYVEDQDVVVKLEHRKPYRFNKHTGTIKM
ncbi:MAG: hypothetical protein JST69_03515 [Bacteroidetes bacterium]|nr:hypothetical protein [Bacteroidota bacterium]